MIDSNDSNGIDAYRQRLSQALGTAEYGTPSVEDTSLPPRLGPSGQGDPSDLNDPYSTPDQGDLPQLPSSVPDTVAQGQGPQTDDGSTQVDASPADPQAAPMAGQGSSQGAGPSAAPIGGGGSDYGASTPTLDAYMPTGLAPQAPTAPTAPLAATAPTAPLAARAAQAPTARSAADAPPSAPTIDGKDAAPGVGSANQASAGAAPATPDPAQGGPKNFDPTYNQDLLSTATTHGQIFAAMDPKSQTQYMDWWEKEHGAVNTRYAQLKKELGTRPDPNRDPTQREKFQTLMDFGMSLLKNSGRGQDPVRATGEALEEATGKQQGRQQAQTSAYDAKSAAIESSRQADQKDLGNYGQAVREDALITDAKTRTSIAIAKSMSPPKPGEPMTRLDQNNNQYQWNPAPTKDNPSAGAWDLSRDKQGKPIPAMSDQGPRGGARGGGSAAPHFRVDSDGSINVWNAKKGQFDPAINSATGRAMTAPQKTGDPGKDFQSMYGKVYNKQYDNADEATQIAQAFVDRTYGPNAIENQRDKRSSVTAPGEGPPASMLTEGKAQKFKDGSTWTLVNGVKKKLN
jgi:hypothetical protein